MTKITIDIDKPYNDKNIEDAALWIISLEEKHWPVIECNLSAHDRLHMDVTFPDDMYRIIAEIKICICPVHRRFRYPE